MATTKEILEWLDEQNEKLSPAVQEKLRNKLTNNKESNTYERANHSSSKPICTASAANSSSSKSSDTGISSSSKNGVNSEISSRSAGGSNPETCRSSVGVEGTIKEQTTNTFTREESRMGLRNTNGSSGSREGWEESNRVSETGQQSLDSYQDTSVKFTALAFDNPAEMYAVFSEDIRLGRKHFHKWQAEMNLLVVGDNFTVDKPLKLVVNACNGSGKDSFFISPVAVFLAACRIRHKVVITSKSHRQIATQTEPYIVAYCTRVNDYFGQQIFDIKQGHIKCIPSGSEIKLFVSDDPNNIEGEHPFDDYVGAELTVIINEAKGIGRDIFQAFSRWTGYTRWLEVSSSGKTEGHMYDAYCMSIPYPTKYILGKWYSRKITVYDCPHITTSSMQEDIILCGGETSEFFRSKYLSEFTSVDEAVVVTKDKVDDCLKNPPKWNNDTRIVGGLDLSGGRDETALVSRAGNKMLKLDTCRIKDAPLLIKYLDEILFPTHSFVKGVTPIYTDAGGMGEPICDMLVALDWKIIKVLNQEKAANKKLYKNRGTNNWFNFGNAVKLRDIILLPDEKFLKQLSNRHYDLPDNDRLGLVSKEEERANGFESPDRADAVVLAFIGFEISTTARVRELKKAIVSKNSLTSVTQKDLVKHMEDRRFNGFEGINLRGRGGRTNLATQHSTEQFSQKTFIEEQLKTYNTTLSNN